MSAPRAVWYAAMFPCGSSLPVLPRVLPVIMVALPLCHSGRLVMLLALTARLRRSLRACQLLPEWRTVGAVTPDGENPRPDPWLTAAASIPGRNPRARLSAACMFCALGWPVKPGLKPIPPAWSLYWPLPCEYTPGMSWLGAGAAGASGGGALGGFGPSGAAAFGFANGGLMEPRPAPAVDGATPLGMGS